jgi:hypothetical protein
MSRRQLHAACVRAPDCDETPKQPDVLTAFSTQYQINSSLVFVTLAYLALAGPLAANGLRSRSGAVAGAAA